MRRWAGLSVTCVLVLLSALLVVAGPSGAGTPGNPDRLSPPLEGWADVKTFVLAPDSSRAVYVADQDVDGRNELFSVPLTGGPALKLNGPLVDGGEVQAVATPRGISGGVVVSADSSTVVYVADQDVAGRVELYSVPIDGGQTLKLNGPLTPDADVDRDVVLSPDGTTAVYEVEGGGVVELYSVPVGGGTPTRLNLGLPGGFDKAVSPDSFTVVFRSGFDLYSVPISGGTPTQLNQPLAPCCGLDQYRISPDSSTVVYLADAEEEQLTELYSVPIGGGQSTKLNAPLPPTQPEEGEDDSVVQQFRISPDSSRVVYVGPGTTERVFELFSAPIGGGVVVKLSGTTGAASDHVQQSFAILADSSTVVYGGTQGAATGVFSAPILGGGTTQLGLHDAWPVELDVSSDSNWAIYELGRELYSAPLSGGGATKLNPELVEGGDVVDFVILADSSRIVYYADQNQDGKWELYSVAPDGSNQALLNGPSHDKADVQSGAWGVTADSTTVVYRADEFINQQFELFAVLTQEGPTCGGALATIIGTAGDDMIEGTSGPDVILGLDGDDLILGLEGRDIICGGRGNDDIKGGPSPDVIYGQKGDDTISGGKGDDTIRGGTGDDTINGRSGADYIRGQGGVDAIWGGTGDDTIHGGAKGDSIFGNGGRDTLFGGKGPDVISGGKKGDDIYGDTGHDTLRGRSGDDYLDGGPGTDLCIGGIGADTFSHCET